MRIRILGIALAVLAICAYAFGGEYTKDDLRMIGEGRGLYLANCAPCHGATLQGHEARNTKAPDLTAIANRDKGFSREHVATHIRFGSSGVPRWLFDPSDRPAQMPPWGVLPAALRGVPWGNRSFGESAEMDLAIAKLVRYLESAQPTSAASMR